MKQKHLGAIIPIYLPASRAEYKPNWSISLLIVLVPFFLNRLPNFPSIGFFFLCFCCFDGGLPPHQCFLQKISHLSGQSSHFLPSLSALPLCCIPVLLLSLEKEFFLFNLAAIPHLKFNFYPVFFLFFALILLQQNIQQKPLYYLFYIILIGLFYIIILLVTTKVSRKLRSFIIYSILISYHNL